MAIFGEDDRKWALVFCVGCRQTTWHYDGLCSNRAFHQGATSYTTTVSSEALAAAQAAEIERRADDEAVAEEC